MLELAYTIRGLLGTDEVLISVRIILAISQTQKIGAIVTKKHASLQKQLSKAIQELRQDGTLKKLSNKYFGGNVTNQ
ncbi:transporter substrate-binding domain-containing protein [Lactiplantibacillus plantarum]